MAIAEANRDDATDLLLLTRQVLQAITGQSAPGLQVLKSPLILTAVGPNSVDTWTALTLDQNLDIATQRKLSESARLEIQRARADHLLRLDRGASISKSTSDSLNTLNQQSTVRSLGVQLTIPLFSGLGAIAQTDQAMANMQRANAELDTSTLDAMRPYFSALRDRRA